MLITTNLFKDKEFQKQLKKLKFKKDENEFRRVWEDEDDYDAPCGYISIELTEYNRVDVIVCCPTIDEWHANTENPKKLIEGMKNSANIINEMQKVFESLVDLVEKTKKTNLNLDNFFVSFEYELNYHSSDGTYIVYGVNSGGDRTEIGSVKLNDFMSKSQIREKIMACAKEYYKKLS